MRAVAMVGWVSDDPSCRLKIDRDDSRKLLGHRSWLFSDVYVAAVALRPPPWPLFSFSWCQAIEDGFGFFVDTFVFSHQLLKSFWVSPFQPVVSLFNLVDQTHTHNDIFDHLRALFFAAFKH
jgi:hypothetical protein